MKALVVDDEPLVRNELVYALQQVAHDCTVREAQNGREALEHLARWEYDIVFLDIRMPGLTGLETAHALDRLPRRPHVVFVTAHENHALEAFEVGACDYLLKPVTEERLAQALRRLKLAAVPPELKPLAGERIAAEIGERRVFLAVGEVRFVQARGHLVTVTLFDQIARVRHTLEECTAQLKPCGFLQVHRAYLVNPVHVVENLPFVAGAYALRMDDRSHSEVPVSRHFASAVRAALGFRGAHPKR